MSKREMSRVELILRVKDIARDLQRRAAELEAANTEEVASDMNEYTGLLARIEQLEEENAELRRRLFAADWLLRESMGKAVGT